MFILDSTDGGTAMFAKGKKVESDIVKKMRKSVIVMQRRFWGYVCARITRQRVRER